MEWSISGSIKSGSLKKTCSLSVHATLCLSQFFSRLDASQSNPTMVRMFIGVNVYYYNILLCAGCQVGICQFYATEAVLSLCVKKINPPMKVSLFTGNSVVVPSTGRYFLCPGQRSNIRRMFDRREISDSSSFHYCPFDSPSWPYYEKNHHMNVMVFFIALSGENWNTLLSELSGWNEIKQIVAGV